MTKSRHLSTNQHLALIASPGPARVKHLVTQAADCEALWGLRDETGWVALADDSRPEAAC
jgi:hypothetical protein